MASDMDSRETEVSGTQHKLNIATGKEKVTLDNMPQEELMYLIQNLLEGVSLAELRVFKPFEDTLKHRGALLQKYTVSGQAFTNIRGESIEPGASSAWLMAEPYAKGAPYGYHLLTNDCVYRHFFEDKETTDQTLAESWKRDIAPTRTWYEKEGVKAGLMLIKRNRRAKAAESIFLVRYEFQTPDPVKRGRGFREQNGIIHTILVKNIPLNDRYFDILGEQAIPYAVHLIQGINRMIKETQRNIREQQQNLARISEKIDPYANAIIV